MYIGSPILNVEVCLSPTSGPLYSHMHWTVTISVLINSALPKYIILSQ